MSKIRDHLNTELLIQMKGVYLLLAIGALILGLSAKVITLQDEIIQEQKAKIVDQALDINRLQGDIDYRDKIQEDRLGSEDPR